MIFCLGVGNFPVPFARQLKIEAAFPAPFLHTGGAVGVQLPGQIVRHPQTWRRTDRIIRIGGGNRLADGIGFLRPRIAGIMLDDSPVVVETLGIKLRAF